VGTLAAVVPAAFENHAIVPEVNGAARFVPAKEKYLVPAVPAVNALLCVPNVTDFGAAAAVDIVAALRTAVPAFLLAVSADRAQI